MDGMITDRRCAIEDNPLGEVTLIRSQTILNVPRMSIQRKGPGNVTFDSSVLTAPKLRSHLTTSDTKNKAHSHSVFENGPRKRCP